MGYSLSIEDHDPSTLRFSVGSEVFASCVKNEEGTPVEGTIIFITATTPEGIVFARIVGAVDYRWGSDEFDGEGILLATADRTSLDEKAVWVSTKLNMARSPLLNPEVWNYYRTVYGSSAYEALNVEATTLAEEKEVDRMRR